MIRFQNAHVTIDVVFSHHLLQQTWVGVPSSEAFRDGSLAIMALAKRHQIKRWLIDLRELRLFNPIDLHWYQQHWLPQAETSLTQQAQIAVVLKHEHQFAKMGADLILRAANARNPFISSRYFVDPQEAQLWLENN